MSITDVTKNTIRKPIKLGGAAVVAEPPVQTVPPTLRSVETFDSTSIILALLMGKSIMVGKGHYLFFNKTTTRAHGNFLYTGLYMRMSEQENWKYSDISFGKFVSFIEQNITGCSITG